MRLHDIKLASTDAIASWARTQLDKRRPKGRLGEEMAIQSLGDTLRALRGGTNAMIFGATIDSVPGLDRPALDAAIVEVLHAWRAHYRETGDGSGLHLLSNAAGSLEPTFRRSLPAPPPSFGDRRAMSETWLARLEALDDAIAARRDLDLDGIAWVGLDDVPAPEVVFGASEPRKLYAFATFYEEEAGEPFPAELAAFFLTAGSLTVDDDPVLEAVASWTFEDAGLRIGCGSAMQGSLILDGDVAGGAPLVDRDDDGVVIQRYADFGAFVDRLLGLDGDAGRT
jgi:hypothetical protein